MFPIKEERDLNSNQNNNRGKGGGNKRNMTAIVSILLWALVLTLLVNLATSRLLWCIYFKWCKLHCSTAGIRFFFKEDSIPVQ